MKFVKVFSLESFLLYGIRIKTSKIYYTINDNIMCKLYCVVDIQTFTRIEEKYI